jgi:ATP-dependent DNA helicase RecQ
MLFNDHDIINSRHHLEMAWPEPETVRQVYQALGNFLQLPVGSGKDVSFDFDFEKFSSAYKLKPVTAFSALKILERDGYISMNDAWDDPSRIIFTCSKDDLYHYQLENAEADKILRVILRSYSGVFTDFTRISENEIARRSGIDSPKVSQLLLRMQKLGIIEYLPHKNLPQLIFSTERLNPDDILLSKTFYSQRKSEAFAMFDSIVNYATSNSECRSRMLVSYFGETNSAQCGICDICLQRKRKAITDKKSNEIVASITGILANGNTSITEIVSQMHHVKENDLIAVLRWLIEEGKVQEDGEILKLV